jgi:phage tail protein X
MSIRKVTVYRTVYDIQSNYGLAGGQGVIRINTTLTMPDPILTDR